MSVTCHGCGAVDCAGMEFRSERIPFAGTRVYCPRCHVKYEEKLLLGVHLIVVAFAVLGLILLWRNPSSALGTLFVNVFLIEIIMVLSTVVHEFAHATVGRLAGLVVPRIWIGRGRTFLHARLLGFDTEFKLIPVGGIAFLAHNFQDRLRLRYFLAVLAGPLANAIILLVAWQFTSWRNLNLETSIHAGAIVVMAQAWILIENLLPYHIETAEGRMCTDGLSLLQLVTSKSPEVLGTRIDASLGTTKHTASRSSNDGTEFRTRRREGAKGSHG